MMKSLKCFFVGTYLMAVVFSTSAQNANTVFNAKQEIVWLGLDFTAVHLIGDNAQWKDGDHIHEVIESMNNLMISEKSKYDIADALYHPNINYELQVTTEHNSHLNLENAMVPTSGDHFLSREDIQEIISSYNFGGLKGIGFMFNMETLNKNAEQATFWATFINLETKEVLFTEKMVEPPSGFGLRNYWSSPIYRAIKEIRGSEYMRWKQKYYRKNL